MQSQEATCRRTRPELDAILKDIAETPDDAIRKRKFELYFVADSKPPRCITTGCPFGEIGKHPATAHATRTPDGINPVKLRLDKYAYFILEGQECIAIEKVRIPERSMLYAMVYGPVPVDREGGDIVLTRVSRSSFLCVAEALNTGTKNVFGHKHSAAVDYLCLADVITVVSVASSQGTENVDYDIYVAVIKTDIAEARSIVVREALKYSQRSSHLGLAGEVAWRNGDHIAVTFMSTVRLTTDEQHAFVRAMVEATRGELGYIREIGGTLSPSKGSLWKLTGMAKRPLNLSEQEADEHRREFQN